MITIVIIIWAVFGILGYIQQKDSLGISVQYQKNISQVMGGGYPGWNWLEAVLSNLFELAMLTCSVAGGVLWFLFAMKIKKQATAERQKVEKTHQRMYGRGWCI